MEAKTQVLNMDCLEFLREQPDKSFDLAVVDPPYGGANDLCINGGGRFGGRFDRYKNGRDMDFTGIEIDKGYFDQSVERFERVCHGVQVIGGHKVEQGSLF